MKKKAGKSKGTAQPSPVSLRRGIDASTRVMLFTRAGGRCEFDGCNKYLLRHALTQRDGNFSQVAHIVAFSTGGPRGRKDARARNSLSNLMLLCPEDHKLIDDNPREYSVTTLRQYKKRHEERIYRLTGMKPDYHTRVLIMQANVGARAVRVPMSDVREAVAPRYPDEGAVLIDLTALKDASDTAYWTTAQRTIDDRVDPLYQPQVENGPLQHLSVFALAPIPLLVHLGSRLSDKIPVELYQRHRNPENWTWKTSGDPVQYRFRRLQAGTDASKVALLLSLSGQIARTDLPQEIDSSFTIYEIGLVKQTPNPRLLRLRQDLRGFEAVYDEVRRRITAEHAHLALLHLFPAVPAPVAVACGRGLLQKTDPCLLVYDYDKARGGFTPTIRINDL